MTQGPLWSKGRLWSQGLRRTQELTWLLAAYETGALYAGAVSGSSSGADATYDTEAAHAGAAPYGTGGANPAAIVDVPKSAMTGLQFQVVLA